MPLELYLITSSKIMLLLPVLQIVLLPRVYNLHLHYSWRNIWLNAKVVLYLFCTCRCLGFLQKYLCLNSWTTFWKLWPKIRVLHLYLPLRQTCISFPTFTETGDLNRDRCSVSSLLSVIHSKLCYRSPVADPNSKGVIFGMSLDTSEKQLALLYLATIQGIAYGTRHIVEHCNAHGHKVCFLRLPSHIVL